MRIGQIYNPSTLHDELRQTIARNSAARAEFLKPSGTPLAEVAAQIRREAMQAQIERRAMFHLDITI